MNTPCTDCPFRKGNLYLPTERYREIIEGIEQDKPFYCHKTLEYSDHNDGEPRILSTSNLCAGAGAYLDQRLASVGGMKANVVFRLALYYGRFDPNLDLEAVSSDDIVNYIQSGDMLD